MITSSSNPRIRAIAKLRNKKSRDEHNLILLDGRKIIQTAFNAGISLRQVFYCLKDKPDSEDIAFISFVNENKIEAIEVSCQLFKKMSYGSIERGFLGVAVPKYLSLQDLIPKSDPLYVVLEHVEKPGNIGAVLRTSDAFGIDGVIVCDPGTDLFNPNTIRASLGTCFTVPYLLAEVEDIKLFFRKRNVKVYALSPDATVSCFEPDLRTASALVVGSEHSGLSADWSGGDIEGLFIPMTGSADSLNVSVALSVVSYEAFRQRRV